MSKHHTAFALTSLVALAGLASAQPSSSPSSSSPVTLTGVVRDFRAANVHNGHPDFCNSPTHGRGVYRGIAHDELNDQGDPVFASTGFKVTTQSMDSQSRPKIGHKSYIADRSGDTNTVSLAAAGGAVTSESSFSDWFRDSPLVNASATFSIPLTSENGMLGYDGDLRTEFASIQGFGGNKVFGYTFEAECTFIQPEVSTVLTFGADDGLWVFINGKLVIDLGGLHYYEEQTIDLARLTELEPGQSYSMKIFYAERDRDGSRFRMQSPLPLQPVDAPAVSSLWD